MKHSFLLLLYTTLFLRSHSSFQMHDLGRNSNIVEKTVMILEKCFLKNYKSMVLDHNLHHFQNWHKILTKRMSVNVIGSSIKDIVQHNLYYLHPYKLNETYAKDHKPLPSTFFILSGSSLPLMKNTLLTLRKSAWWNHDGLFIIVNENLDDYCDFADEFLLLAWRFDILSAIFVCVGHDKRPKLFTFNPYSSYSPDFWEEIGTNLAYDRQPWHLFLYSHEIIGAIDCDKLYFEKTRRLKNYHIKVVAGIFSDNTSSVDSEMQENVISKKNIIRNVWSHLEVDASMNYTRKRGDVGTTATGMIRDILRGRYDAGHDERYHRDFWKMETYPHSVDEFCSLTHDMGSTTKLAQISLIFSSTFWVIIFLSLLFSTVLFKCMTKHSFSWAMLYVLAIFVGYPVSWRPTSPHGRVIFLFFTFLLLAINTMFVSYLSSYLTVSTARQNINTLQDLMDSDLKVHAQEKIIDFLRNPILKKRSVYSDLETCYKKIKRGEYIACVDLCQFVKKLNHVPGVTHLSTGRLGWNYITFATRENWPLHGRVDQILQRLNEGGLIKKIKSNRYHLPRYSKRTNKQKILIDSTFELRFDHLNFNFYLFAMGVVCAVVVFLGELMVYSVDCKFKTGNRIDIAQ